MHYYAQDVPGSVVGLIDSQGGLANEYRYTPWGELESVRETVPNALGFQAREWDEGTGMYYFRNRWYDPQLRRFNSEDPIGLAGGINLYAFTENNPVNFTDPYGLEKCQAGSTTVFVTRADGTSEIVVKCKQGGGAGPGKPFVPGKPGRGPTGSGPSQPAGPRAPRGGGSGDGANDSSKNSWGACGIGILESGIGIASDVTLIAGVGLAFKGAMLVRAGRAGLASVRSKAVREGRGALLRSSRARIAGGKGMVGYGAGEAAFGWAGDVAQPAITTGLQQTVVLENDPSGSPWAWVPVIGTGMQIIETGKDCWAAAN